MGIKMSAAFPSKYLKAADLQGQTANVVIERIEMGEMDNADDRKPIVYFKNKQKGLVLNKTNSNKIVSVYGDDSDGWIGKPITLFTAWVDFRGETVEAIRVRVTSEHTAPHVNAPVPSLQSAQKPLRDELEDEIPF